jgi:hypothetical protein
MLTICPFKLWYTKPHREYIGNGILEQIVSGADNQDKMIDQSC